MSDFKKCERCGAVWADDIRFAYVEVTCLKWREGFELCPTCHDELTWFLDHPEEGEEEK